MKSEELGSFLQSANIYMFNFKVVIQFTHQQCMKVVIVPHRYQNLVIRVFNFSHFGECPVVFHCGFNIYFLNC